MGMGRGDQYHTHTCIVDGYKILPVPVPMGMKLYPYTHTLWVPVPIGYPTGGSNTTQVTHYFTFIHSILGARTWNFDLLNVGTYVDYNQCLITRVNGVWDAQLF
jgi:hypothetical protein